MAALLDLREFPPFGRLTVIERAPNQGGRVYWWCQCVCGTRHLVRASHLVNGLIQSCGCFRKEWARDEGLTHGMTQSPEYRIWAHIKGRCLNINDRRYPGWGGRGIEMCLEWQDSFEAFFDFMGPRPSPQHTIERKNNNGPYAPGNCVWLLRPLQARNRRNNHVITLNGDTRCLAEWLEILGLSRATYQGRRKRGWSVERALTTTPRALRKKATT